MQIITIPHSLVLWSLVSQEAPLRGDEAPEAGLVGGLWVIGLCP